MGGHFLVLVEVFLFKSPKISMNWYKKSDSSSKSKDRNNLKVVKPADSPKDSGEMNKEIVDYCKRHGITSVTRDR